MKKNFYKILSFLLIVLNTLVSGLILYFEILPLKYLIFILIALWTLVIILSIILNKKSKKKKRKIIVSIISIIFILGEILGFVYGIKALDFLNNIIDTGYRIEVYNLYVHKDSKYEKLNDLENKQINLYKQETESYEKALLKLEDKIVFKKEEEDSITSGVDKLIDGEIDGFFVNESLMNIYKEDNDKYSELKILESFEVIIKSKSSFKTVDITEKPFTLYLSGIDSSGNINVVSRSDVNILAVVNPKTHKILLVNTPRDYYVTLGSKGAKDKLTHAGIYGIDESAMTLSKLYNIDINYYGRVNFTSFVKIINALNGITVDSKYSFNFEGHYFKKGLNNLNGVEALAFTRERKSLPGGDLARGENQQAVIKGIINKLSDPEILVRYSSVLNSLEDGVITNLDKNTLTKFINMQIKKNIKWEIENINLTGKDSYNTTYSTGSSSVYVMIPDPDSLSEAKLKISEIINGI